MTIASVDYALCIACGSCIELCPMDVLRAGEDGAPVIAYAEDCQCCYLCELRCPTDALLVLPERAFTPRQIYGIFDPRSSTTNAEASPREETIDGE